MRAAFIATLLWVVGVGYAAAPTSRPTTRPFVQLPPAKPLDLSQTVDRASLDALDRAELGNLYTPAVAPKLYAAHELIEKYFAASAADRKAIVKDLEATGLDPTIIGRLTRIRTHWPQLDGGVQYVNQRVGPYQVVYFLGVPKGYDRTKSWPVVIKLISPQAVMTSPTLTPQRLVELYTGWVQDELNRRLDALVLVPALNLIELWGPSYRGMNTIIQPMLHAAGVVNIDPRRVYIRGHAMSGYAVWNIALHYPTYFAAINPMTGGVTLGFQRVRLQNLRNIGTIVWHDADDKTYKVELSRQPVDLLKRFKFDVDYEETKTGQSAPGEEVATRQYQKLRTRVRELYPKQVVLSSDRPESIFNRNDWVQVYQPLTPGPEKRMRLQVGSGYITTCKNSWGLTATIEPQNRITVKSDNVESMRFYLNDQMLDLAKPVTVTVNGIKRFEGTVTPSIDKLLKDQVFLGRGWRYYPASIEVDLIAATTQPATPPSRRGAAAD